MLASTPCRVPLSIAITPSFKPLALVLLLFAVPSTARAEAPSPTSEADDVHGSQESPRPDITDADSYIDTDMVGHEIVEIWDERPDKPFNRDTEARLSGEELLERGATNLAEALELLPDIYVREAGRGGRQIDIRAARKGSIKVMVDGVAVDDPFYGNFDLTSIPATDIVQIRVSSSPASPIDGIGGPGGVIEVHTRDAVGGRRVEARLQGSTLRSADAAVTGRSMLGEHLAMRISASGALGMRGFSVAMPGDATASLDEQRSSANGALRLEYRRGDRRIVADIWAQDRAFMVPPGEDGQSDILIINGENAARLGVRADDVVGATHLQGRAYLHGIQRSSTYFSDASLSQMQRTEDLSASRAGVGLLANRPVGKWAQLIASAAVDSERGDIVDMVGTRTGGRATAIALSTGFQLESGEFKLDSAGGVAVPVGIDASPWPEFKLVAAYAPRDTPLELKATAARKGRIPTLRERFRLDIGNESLGPEQALFGEIAATIKLPRAAEMRVASYLRRSNGQVRFDGELAQLMNTGELIVRGVDAKLQLGTGRALYGGVSWSFTDAYSPTLGTAPLDFLPSHRGESWFGARHGSRFGGLVRIRYVGEQIDRGNSLKPRTSGELSAYARLKGMTGSLKLGNVTDASYLIRSGGVRAPGRSLSLTLQGVFE